ncbi:MAG: 5'/3'-nucleotidase SurE [Wenzhouxiangella sp.]|nr:5'/3'-nucleotidase SurE [Wenzhouxiangella sp.]
MHILIANDDGVYAPGIRLLAQRLSDHCDRVTVVAPDRDRSGASNSLTLDQPIRVERQDDGRYKVFGTPTDCVHVAITGLLEAEPDMVVSGINAGANLGDDVLYSGTVAAAMEGRFLGLPAMAVSLVYGSKGPRHYETAAEAACILMKQLLAEPLPADTILNVNVPDQPWAEIRGFETTRLGHRHRSENVIPLEDPRGRSFFWVGPPGDEEDNGPGTDFNAVRQGYVSVTPIHVDLTRYQALEQVSHWIERLNDREARNEQ